MDQEEAKAPEEKAEAEYATFKKESEAQIQLFKEKIVELDGTMASKADEAVGTKKERLAEKQTLDATMKTLKDLEPGCDFAQVNFKMRAGNRAIELDGLIKAKAILKGA